MLQSKVQISGDLFLCGAVARAVRVPGCGKLENE